MWGSGFIVVDGYAVVNINAGRLDFCDSGLYAGCYFLHKIATGCLKCWNQWN